MVVALENQHVKSRPPAKTKISQWNKTSLAKSGGSSQGRKMNFSKILTIVGNFFGTEGCPKLKIFSLASKVGDKNTVKRP